MTFILKNGIITEKLGGYFYVKIDYTIFNNFSFCTE